MKKFFVILMALLMISAAALADVTYYPPHMVVSLEGNPTTGYEWSGTVSVGDAVSMTEEDWTYVPDDETGTTDGAGGTYYVTLHPEHAGQAIVSFSYARSWESTPVERQLWLITVEEDWTMTAEPVIALEGNPTTGYEWTGMVVAGDAVSMTEQNWTYVSDDETGTLAGAGGTYYVTMHPEHTGRAVVSFSYGRSWENEVAEQQLWLITVDDDNNMTVENVTEVSLMQGIVLQVMESDHSVLLQTGTVGEVIAHIADEDAMPVEGEEIRLYTDGIVTLSLPAQVNALGWSTIPGELAR